MRKGRSTKGKADNFMRQEEWIVREMTIADHDRVLALMRATPGITVREADSREATEAYLRRNPGLSFIAERSGKIVGCVMCGYDGRRGYLQHLVVEESERRNGIGSAMIDRCLEALERHGIVKTHVHVFCDHALANAYWTAKGWQRRDDLNVYSCNRSSNPNA